MVTQSLVALAFFVGACLSHPGHDHTAEAHQQRDFIANTQKHDLSHCAEQLAAAGLPERAIERRAATLNRLQLRSGLEVRDTRSLGGEHESTKPYTAATDFGTIFTKNSSCVLNPETIEGPFYVTGESIRANIVEKQPGIPLAIDLQVVDVNTCQPVVGAAIEIWHANSTGVYGGVLSNANGVGASDQTNINNTWLRGVQMTDKDGAAQFETIFPGHYQGRATHVHVMVHLGTKERANHTISDSSPAHVGQLYFDQVLVDQVRKAEPYSTNKQRATANSADLLLRMVPKSADPYVHFHMLGDKLQDGLLAWYSFGVNTTFRRTVQAAATVEQDGGHVVKGKGKGAFPRPGGGAGWPFGNPGGFGGPPSGDSDGDDDGDDDDDDN